MRRLRVTLLGGFQAEVDQGAPLALPAGKIQALLAYLALPPGQVHPRDKLATLLWGNTPDDQARQSLRQALYMLRRALPATDPVSLRLEGEGAALNPAAVDVDVAAFERAVAEGTPPALERAAELYRGDLLEGIALNEGPFEEWLLAERERLRELALEALARLLAHQREIGATDAAVRTVLRLLALDPLQEAAHRALMRLYVQQGRRGAALRQYQRCVAVLQREFNIDPEAETKTLYQGILRQRPAALSTAPQASTASKSPSERSPISGDPLDILLSEVPLVGREPEMARLRTALESAVSGRGECFAIVGEAGVGKSRLVAELVAEAAQRGLRVLLGRCYEAEHILPFGPWVAALRAGHIPRDADTLQQIAPVWRAELGRLLPEVGPSPVVGGGDYLHLFESVAELLRTLAAGQPLLVVLEDLQWADEMSVRLLAFLVRRLASLRTLVLVTAQEEEVGAVPTLSRTLEELSRERHVRTLALGLLSRSDTLSLVKALGRAGGDEARLQQLGEQVWQASEGNPFVAVEMVREREEGTTAATTGPLPLPERVRQVVAARLQRLREPARALVAVAAVIGREFDFALLQRAAGLDEREAAEGLEELVRRRVLHGVRKSFDFTHHAIRQGGLADLSSPRRQLLHRRVAETLERLHAQHLEPHTLAIGVHYREGEAWEKSIPYLQRAGGQAVVRSAHREAVACYEQALDSLGHVLDSRETVEQAIDIRLALHSALIPLGEPTRTGAHLLKAEAQARALGDQARLGRVTAHLTNYFWLAGESDRAVEAGERACAIAEALDDQSLRIAGRCYLGQALHFRGDYRQAIAVLRPNLDAFLDDRADDRCGLPGLAAVLTRGWLCWSLAEVGAFAEGITLGEEAVRIAEAADHAFSRADAYRELGCLYLRQGNLPPAIAVLTRGFELCRTRDLALWVPSFASALGYAHAMESRLDDATRLLEQALERATSLGILAGHAIRTVWLAETYLRARRPIDALALARRALELARDRHERGNQGWAHRLLAEIARQHDPWDAIQAEHEYGQAMALAQELGMRPLVAHCHRGLGQLHQLTGKEQEAQDQLNTATTMYREMDMQFWLEQAEAEMGA